MRVFWLTAVILVVDQLTKQWVANAMLLGESIPVLGDWLRLTYTLNPGMAFGIEFGPPGLITVFAIAATGLIIYYMVQVRGGYRPYLYSLGAILGGALGNIIDRTFYGLTNADQMGGLFLGQVVDFIHVNLWRGQVPDIVPFLGGSYAALFPIWNVADMAIVLGVVGILAFQGRFHEIAMARSAARRAEAAPDETSGDAPPATPQGAINGEEGTATVPPAPLVAKDAIQTRVDPAVDAPLAWSSLTPYAPSGAADEAAQADDEASQKVS